MRGIRSFNSIPVSKLPNGLVIASLENHSPMSSVGLFVKAGSRHETVENPGVAHVLRLAANLTTKGSSAFKICRGVEALGGSLRPSLLEYLSDVTTAQEFRQWELEELTTRVKIDKAMGQQSPQIGVNHSVLRQLGEGLLSSRSGPGAPVALAAYRGGEARMHSRDDLVHLLVASEGSAVGSAQANAFSVLQHVLGAGPHVKRGSNITSKLSQGIAKATSQPFDVIKAAISQIRDVAEGNVADADIDRAKNQVKVEYLMSLEDSDGLLQEIGAQALMTGTYQAPDTVLQAVGAVTPEDVVKANRGRHDPHFCLYRESCLIPSGGREYTVFVCGCASLAAWGELA
ncbi:hypothetical protein NQD34_006425 [Periophthalmus magnuspinnatus]|nr:hypothetical protein NQD34_006425 [Periophthalmus magnuspinnatus]